MMKTQNYHYQTNKRKTQNRTDNRRRYTYKVTFFGQEHKDRFYKKLRDFNTDLANIPNDLLSAVFLLSYNNFLWRKVGGHIHFSHVDFESFDLSGVNTNEYLVFKASQSVYGVTEENGVSLYDLADRNLCSGRIAKAICDGVMIKRYGLEVL